MPLGRLVLGLLLALCAIRLWLMPLPSSFWLDEMVTVFIVQHGPSHPSLAVVPAVWNSLYYFLPRASHALLGSSEIAYRIPSVVSMAIALLLIARIAVRLIHPEAAWFAVFACFALRGINDEAADARPYAFGTCIAAAGVLFLIRWLDSGGWPDALLFVFFGALLWRVHLLFWPFYIVYVAYAAVRRWRGETAVRWSTVCLGFALLALSLAPVLWSAWTLLRDAKAHVIVRAPMLGELEGSLKLGRILACFGGAWLLSRMARWSRDRPIPSPSALTLIAAWWLCQPFALFAYSRLTGNSVFVNRYLYLSLPGAALTACVALAFFIPSPRWKPLAAALAVGVLLMLGDWHTLWPRHKESDWRAAARAINQLELAPYTPVVCPSPFIEAKPPVWRPDYPLPGWLYAHLAVYPVSGKPYLLPFEASAAAQQYATELSKQTLASSGRFVIYGDNHNVFVWRDFFAARPELAGWSNRRLGPFGDVDAVLFETRLRPYATIVSKKGHPVYVQRLGAHRHRVAESATAC